MLREEQPFEVPGATVKPKFPVKYPKKGCWSRTTPVTGNLREGSIGRELSFEELDRDGDGVVSREEYEQAMLMKVLRAVVSLCALCPRAESRSRYFHALHNGF